MNVPTRESILHALAQVPDPATGKNLVDQGRVLRLDILDQKIFLDIETTQPAMHVKKKLENDIQKALEPILGDASLSLHVMLNSQKRKEERKLLPGVKHIIAVASGKGGVGKSTVTVNLACALAQMGQKVGIVDADIYGPSVPLMMDTKYVRPKVVQTEDGRSLIAPVENYGIKMLSIGFFAGDDQAVVWRGPMASKALTQMFSDADWGELDFLLLDLPPGTGDIHLTLVSQIPLSGAVIVSTPQEVALADARKGVAMFTLPNINVPVIGLVENMAWFTPENHPEEQYFIFGKDGVKKLADELKLPLLGQIPLVQGLRESGDIGFPAALVENHPARPYFRALGISLIEYMHLRARAQAQAALATPTQGTTDHGIN